MAYGQDRRNSTRVRSDERFGGSDAPGTFHYRAFISYSHEDEAAARWLHKALETWRPPRHLIGQQTPAGRVPKTLAPIFRDREELPSSASLNQQVNQALAESASLIVICSPAAAHSRWVNQEVKAFQRLGRAARVFCLIVRGEPNAGLPPSSDGEDCFVPALRQPGGHTCQDTETGGEPIAADLRPGRDGKRLALLKLVSGMLGLGLDDLRMREHQRRLRRLSLITAGAVLVMVVTIALAITALLARRSAEAQQSQAEGLVGFMLNDLNGKLQDTNRLNTLQAVNDRAMAYYNSLPSRDVDDSVLAGRAEALKNIGSVRLDQGRLKQALAAFEAAEKITAQLLARHPGSVARMKAQANILTWLGTTHWYQGDHDPALAVFHNAVSILKKADAHAGSNTDTAYQLALAQNNIGRILERRGDLEAAASEFQSVLETFRNLHEREPSNNRWYSELGFAYNNLGKLAWQRGQLASGIAFYQTDLHIKLRLSADDPGKRQWQSDLALTRAMLGNALLGTGALAAAENEYRHAVTAGRAIVEFDPDNMTSLGAYAGYNLLLGRALRLQGKLQPAAAFLDKARGVLGKLASNYPDNVSYRQDLAGALVENARLQFAQGFREAAMHHDERAVATARALLQENAADSKFKVLLAEALLVKASVLRADKDFKAAALALHEARDLIEPLGRSSSNPDFLDPWANVLLMLGDQQSAAKVVSRLDVMGYRNPDFLKQVAQHGLSLLYPSPGTTPKPGTSTPGVHDSPTIADGRHRERERHD